MRHRFFLAAGLLILTASQANAACIRFMNFRLTSEGPWQGHGSIQQGKSCSGSYTAGGTMVFKRLYLVQAPAHGKVQLREGGTYFYTAPTGFTGSDPFTLRVCGREGAVEGCANLVYNMTVN
ncbi:MAG: Ig-like domain-containing protein [Bradyrhizobium sp.]